MVCHSAALFRVDVTVIRQLLLADDELSFRRMIPVDGQLAP